MLKAIGHGVSSVTATATATTTTINNNINSRRRIIRNISNSTAAFTTGTRNHTTSFSLSLSSFYWKEQRQQEYHIQVRNLSTASSVSSLASTGRIVSLPFVSHNHDYDTTTCTCMNTCMSTLSIPRQQLKPQLLQLQLQHVLSAFQNSTCMTTRRPISTATSTATTTTTATMDSTNTNNNNGNRKRRQKKKKIQSTSTVGKQPPSSSSSSSSTLFIPHPNKILSLEHTMEVLLMHCQIRNISLTKRQTLKPWIMVLLLHRYDRGIRTIHELNTDAIYYKDTISLSSSVSRHNGNSDSGGFDGADPCDIDFDSDSDSHYSSNGITTNNNSGSIDLRYALTPSQTEIEEYLIHNNISEMTATTTTTTTIDSSKKDRTMTISIDDDENKKKMIVVSDIIRNQKLACLAIEARRIIMDRQLPFFRLANIKDERHSRQLSKNQPSVFLSLFARAFCVVEPILLLNSSKKKKKKNVPVPTTDNDNDQNDGNSNNDRDSIVAPVDDDTKVKSQSRSVRSTISESRMIKDFSHRRTTPPSLKKAAYLKAKKKEKMKEKNNRKMKFMKNRTKQTKKRIYIKKGNKMKQN